mmetsp:Transcript_5374/g.12297  ORF Transcript_5374/g.12297 Transcript_5374/m.12297 type:complete len:251 (+) Transcript_5374:602-1354(+)
MCSVRNSPMPTAPNPRAFAASEGESALVCTCRRACSSQNPRKVVSASDPMAEASMGNAPRYTTPLVPLRVSASPSRTTMSPTRSSFLRASTSMASAPTMQHLPQPRATSAACEVMPPRAVRIASAARMPATSSGLVSSRTRMTCSLRAAASMAAAAVKTTLPVAPPGPAGKPRRMTLAFFSAAGSMTGCRSSSSWRGRTRVTAVLESIKPSLTMSTAICTAAGPLRLPTRHCNMKSFPSWMVNSMSSMSW